MQFKGKKQLTPYTKDELAQRNIKTFKLKGYNIGFALKPTVCAFDKRDTGYLVRPVYSPED